MEYEFVEVLRELRKNQKLTQEKLAEKCNFSRSKIANWERGGRNMTVTDAIKLADFFGISTDRLLNKVVVNTEEYIHISQEFFKNSKLSLDEKVKIIGIIEDGIKKDNINELYQKYKMTQNETKCN